MSRESHLSTFDGLPTLAKLDMISKSGSLPLGLHNFINQLKQEYTLEICYQRCKPVFNQQYALNRLHNEGYTLAVCSNSVRKTVEEMMRLSSLSAYLQLILSNQDVENGKPSPEMYLKAMELLSVQPENCLILEDNENGIRAAIGSGAHVLKIGLPEEVTYRAIKRRIREIECP